MTDLEIALALIDDVTDGKPEMRALIKHHLERYLDALTTEYEIDFGLDDSN